MESIVHNFGSFLEDCVKSDSAQKAGKRIKLIRKFLDNDIENNILDFMISKIFDEPYNFLTFLINIKDKAVQKIWKDVLTDSLDLLNHFLNNFFNKLRTYNITIINTCRSISTSNAHANEKSKAINILSYVLKSDCDVSLDDITNIYEYYFKFCNVHQKNTAAKVQRSIFVLLGIICNKYPYIITNHNNIIDTYVNQLKRQSECSEKERDNTVVSGCTEGLSKILETFPITDEQQKTKIYKIISKLLLSGSTRFDIKDVVQFVSNHCSMLIENIYMDQPELWFETIKKWALLLKGDKQKAGYVALEKFYTELANILKNTVDDKSKKCFEFFFDYFLQTIKNDKADIIEVRLAIRGFGYFALPCEAHMTKQKLSQMFIIIVNQMEQDYFVQENPSVEQLEYLPDYIHCFSSILHQIGEYSFSQIDSLQQISVLMIKTFPKLSAIYHFSIFDSMILTMCYLYQFNPKSLENYLQRVVYQGVLWTCSHRTSFDILDEDEKAITYKNYLPFWKSLLNFMDKNDNKYNNIDIDIKKSVVQILYDELMKTLLIMINKLNLNTKTKDDIPITDPQNTCEAEKIDDFIIFINIVDFYIDLFTSTNNEYFKKWLKMYTNQLMSKSMKYPLVSGFYKLLTLGLKISEDLKYFEEMQMKKKEDRQISHRKILSYLEKVLSKVHEFKDDLQLSCLQLLLTIPLSFVPALLPGFTPIFEISLNVGKGYLPLAVTTVDTLEKWYRHLPIKDLKPLLKNVLPHLDPFLRSRGFIGDTDIKLSLLEAKKSKNSKIKRKVFIEQDTELNNLQNKILMFVGQLDSEICLYLIKTDVEIDQVTWDKQPYLKFTLPYNEIKPNIYLDRIIPRILELALSSGDQKTRITACELLHSIVIFMLGTSRQMTMSELNQMSKLLEKVMLPIIQLGCDTNDVVRQLFNPLVFQIVHWYSSPLQIMSTETTLLIDILMDGISHPNNTAVRDISGKCIKEFVIWAIKQSQKEDLEKNSQNIHTIVKKICTFSLHPNPFKRLGAALAFNNLYSHLREEESMIDKYWILLMYSLMISMSLEDSHCKNITQLDAALNHIERVLREKNQVFNKHSVNRKVPSGINGPLLKDAVMWILKQTASNNKIYRQKCIKLFCSLSPYVDSNCGCAKNFITKFISDEKWFIKLYETEFSTLDFWEKLGTTEILFKWFQDLLKILDAFKYLLDYGIINSNNIQSSTVYESVHYFIENIATNKLENCLKLFKQYDTAYICLPDEIESFSDWKCNIIIGILNYLLSLLNKNDFPENLTQEYFYKFICYCVFEPNKLGFNTNDILEENETILTKILTEIFNKLCRKLSDNYLQIITNQLYEYFNQNYDKNINLNKNISLQQRNLLKGWLLILNSDLRNKLQDSASSYFEQSVEKVFDVLVEDTGDKKIGIKLQSTIEEYAKLQLELCFKLVNSTQILCDKITNVEIVKMPEMHSTVTYGEYFLNYFNYTIIEYILLHNNETIKILCSKWNDFNNTKPINILILILKYLTQNQQLKKKVNVNDLFENIMYSCKKFFKTSSLNLKDKNFQIELLSHIIEIDSKNALLMGKNFEFIKIWFLDQLKFYPETEIPKTILQFHINVLSFIHCFSGPTDDEDIELESTLNLLLHKIFNTPSNQLDNSDLLVMFKKLLDYLIISKSRILLKTIGDIFTTLKYEEENLNISKALEQYLNKISTEQQLKTLIKIYEYTNEINYEKKYKIVKIFLLNMLRFCHYQAFEDFYIQKIKNIIDNLKIPLNINCSAKDIVNKSIDLILIDALFTRINTSNFNNKSCPITKILFTEIKKGTELLKQCMLIVHTILKNNLKFDDDRKELYRLYNCDALNCLISILCNYKSPDVDMLLFRKLFFESKDDRNIWKNIIDCEEQITVPQDFDKLPSRKKIFVNIRKQYQQQQEKTIYYIESQSLFNSTLSEDICKFDFTNTLVRSSNFNENNSKTEITNSIGSMVLKAVDYNNHECMPFVCDLINYMIDNKISPLPNDIQQTNLPLWMEDIKKILIDSTMNKNVRIFVARIIHNTQHIFKYYATHFFDAIVKFITDECTGNNINYFTADLVLMLTTWNENLEIQKLRESVSSLIKFLIQYSCNDRQDMLKYNLEIIKTCVQIWKTNIEIPHEILFNKLQNPNFQEKLVAVHLTGIILANDIVPWTDENINNFIKGVVTILNKEKLKKITRPTSELIGMILKYLEEKNHLQNQFVTLNKQLDDIFRQVNSDKWYTSLEQIQIHYPPIIDKHFRKIAMYVFNDIDTNLKCICLKNILRRLENNESRFTYKDVIDLLNMNDRDVKLLTLQIINKIFMEFKKQQLILVVNTICESKTDSNSIIRYAMYEVLMSIYDYYIKENYTESIELIKLCKTVLLSGLIDSDSEIQERLEEYWFNKYQDLKLSQKIVKFLSELYLPDIESFYMGCMNYFLLHSCKNAPEYKKLMFEHPLSDCKFDEFQLVYNWRLLNASMTPMFSNTLSKNEFSAPKLIGIRETNSIRAFEPTQSSIDLSSSLDTTSSFLFDGNTIQSKNISQTKKNEKSSNVYGRMFLSPNTRSLNFVKDATERNIKTEQQRKEKIKRKETNVVMYRQYRKGDLPDIQIPFSALIDPLKILARRDGTLARQLYSMLLSGIINELDNSEDFIQNFNEGILSIFNQTYMFVPNVIGAFLDTAFENNKKRNIRKIYLNCDVLSNVCKNSGLISLGCLLMEEYICMNDDLPTAPKAGCGRENNEVKQWVKLADMYKELNEWDAVIGIFSSNQMNCSSEIANAIETEASCNWKEALNQYETLLNSDTDSNRKDFYYESLFKCFANLSDWKNMSKTVCELSDSSFWDGDWNQEKLLPWYIMAETCINLEGDNENTILKNLEEWSKDKEKSEYLKDKFSEELAVLSLLQNDINFCRHYIKYSFGKFLEDWSHLNPLSSKIRSRKLLNFQKNVDMNKFLIHKNYKDLINHWQMSKISSYSIPSTEIRTLYRLRLINNIEAKCSQDSQDFEEFDLKDIKLTSHLNLIDYAVKNNNHVVGRKYCRESQKYISKYNKLGNFKLLLAMSKVGYILANTLDEKNKLIKLTDSWYKLDTICKKYSNTFIDLQIESTCEIYKIIQNIKNVNLNSYSEIKQKIQSLISQNVESIHDIENYGISKLRSSIKLGENTLKQSENIKVLNNLIEAYLNLIMFAQNQNSAEYHKDIVKYVLRAMKLGSRDARQIFPCLLQFPELNGNLLELFKTESSSVPTWMFLLWIPQLLASLNSYTLAVEDIIECVALTYPQAIIYMYKLARENYDLNNADTHFKNLIEKLDHVLSNTLVDKFLNEISHMCIPELYINYYIEKVVKKCTNCTEIKIEMKKLEVNLNKRIQQSDNFKSSENSLRNLLQEIENITNLEDMKTILYRTYKNNKRFLTINKSLKHYSTWLSNFKSSDWNSELEIPGQYSGDNKPLVKYHSKISSFQQKVSCITDSLRKPFYIKIFGNDSKEYSFLIKFGEDLRQDQRIQQLFTLTNNILKSDIACQERNLIIEQYEVIPLTKCLGMIKIVENSKSLSEFMYSTAKDDTVIKNYKNVQIEYSSWIRAAASQGPVSDSECYAKACLTYDRNEANKMFTRFVNAIPADILSKSFWSISMCPSTYTYLRQQFITSYTVMCIVHWLLGIGDRNLGNSLICLRTGRIVGIDFGYAFGATTQHLPIPELIPFRLTPHILNLMDPLKQIGFVEKTMIHCLKALKNKKHLLISTMDVFIKDPSVDWLEFAKSQFETEEISWYPNLKIDIVNKKLSGANPSSITIQELKYNNLPSPVRDAYINIVKGDDGTVRKQLDKKYLNEEEQIKCLLDQATDYNILARHFAGLQLWI